VRKSSKILTEQRQNTRRRKYVYHALIRMVHLARELKDVLLHGDLDDFGKILHEGWMLKKSLANNISDDTINSYYVRGIRHGKALGGKLLGAGGGGHLLFYCTRENQPLLRKALRGLQEVPFEFDFGGSVGIDDCNFFDNFKCLSHVGAFNGEVFCELRK
jgi:D-glycero-alpha-D-manno-heptose-7-phosphate kinase